MVSIVKHHFFLIVLIFIVLIISYVNFKPNTWLSGWDTLHPEFNFALYFKRIIFGVWQEHQGLGAVASQAHASEIPRLIIYYPLSLIFPESSLRYLYFFITLFIGTIGMFFYLKNLVFKRVSDLSKNASSFVGALFYLLNLSTLQQYYVPLEMFATHFATLPWLFLYATKFLEDGKKSDLILFSVFTFFAMPMAHTPTLFYIYFSIFFLYLITAVILKKTNTLKPIVLLISALFINSLWLLPNLYFIIYHGKDIELAKINLQFSDLAFSTGQKFGNIENVAILKNFLFDWGRYDFNRGQFIDLMEPWLSHFNNPLVLSIGYLLFIGVLTGISLSLIKFIRHRSQNNYGLLFLPLIAICLILLLNEYSLTNFVYNFLSVKLPIIKESLRFPFTKISIISSFIFALYISITFNYIYDYLLKINLTKKTIYLMTFVIFLSQVYYMFPAFNGHLIDNHEKVTIPQEYFSMFDWFEKQDPSGRIAALPINTFWGWAYYKWGYEGGGFRWFGLNQPILDREFDRWFPSNENFYWEISYALYSQNNILFKNVLEKYQVKWLLVDENIIDPSSPKSVYYSKINKTLSLIHGVNLVKEFGKMKIYKISLKTPINNNLILLKNPTFVSSPYKWNNEDSVFSQNGHYVNNGSLSFNGVSIINPFNSLFTGRRQEEREFNIEDKGNYFIISKDIPVMFENYHLKIPSQTKNDSPQVENVIFDGYKIKVYIPKISISRSSQIDFQGAKFDLAKNNCNSKENGQVSNKIIVHSQQSFLRLTAFDANNCSASFTMPELTNNLSYLIDIKSRNVTGRGLLFWIENLNSRRQDLESFLPNNNEFKSYYFIQPPMEKDGIGYRLHFDNISIGNSSSINDMQWVMVYAFPYNYLKNIKLISPTTKSENLYLEQLSVKHSNPFLYETILPNNINNDVLVLSQAYDPGWQAFVKDGFFIRRLKNHVLVNNWENGWVLDQNIKGQKIVIFYWPQLLEFLGFLMLGVYLIWLLFSNTANRLISGK